MRIKAAAILKDAVIFTGRTHDRILAAHPGELRDCEQGFVTDSGEFVSRKKAARIAHEAGQIQKQDWPKLGLFSEELIGQDPPYSRENPKPEGNMLTNQEIFNKAINGLMAQGAPSVDAEGHCLYRGPNGLKCGAGQLIDDEFYSPKFEGECSDSGMLLLALEASGVPKTASELVAAVQSAHDSSSKLPNFLKDLRLRLRRVAGSFSLTAPESLS